jgi:hypothetical protein
MYQGRPCIAPERIDMGKTIAVVQSNYIPWRGYFDLINSVDEFILYDDMQYTRRDWRNRNKIKSQNGLTWLTIPVQVKGKYSQKIKDTVVVDNKWAARHWRTIFHNYSKASHFSDYKELFQDLYLGCQERLLSQINYRFITAICQILGITTTISWSMDYQVTEGQTERLVSLCEQAGATGYLSGPGAKVYLDEELFKRRHIAVAYMDYSDYGNYKQLFPPFEANVSIIDLVFNEGSNASNHLKSCN